MQLGLFSISYGGLWGQAALDLRVRAPRRSTRLRRGHARREAPAPVAARRDADAVAALRDELHTANVKCAVVAAYTDLTPANAR